MAAFTSGPTFKSPVIKRCSAAPFLQAVLVPRQCQPSAQPLPRPPLLPPSQASLLAQALRWVVLKPGMFSCLLLGCCTLADVGV
jgi:hypothetical protein